MWRSGPRGQMTLTAMAAGTSNWGLFVLSAHHAGTVTAAVLYQLWPICYGVVAGGARRVAVSSFGSHDGGVDDRRGRGRRDGCSDPNRCRGRVGVVVGRGWCRGGVCGYLSGFGLAASIVVAYEILERRSTDPTAASGDKLVVMATTLMVACMCGTVINAVLAVASSGNRLGAGETIAAAGLGVCICVGSVAARVAHVRSAGLGITAVMGLDAVFGVVWLALAGAGIINWPLFVVGVAALVVVNTTIQARETSTSKTRPGLAQRLPL